MRSPWPGDVDASEQSDGRIEWTEGKPAALGGAAERHGTVVLGGYRLTATVVATSDEDMMYLTGVLESATSGGF